MRANREVIVSAGAIQSPQLLMVSGIGPKEHLRELNISVVHDAAGVGSNLQDHVAIGGMSYLVNKPANLTRSFTFNLMNTINAHSLRLFANNYSGPMYSVNVAEGMAFINTK